MSNALDQSRDVKIRPIQRNDLPYLKKVIDSSGLFPSEMLNEMMTEYFHGDESQLWITYCDPVPVAIAYCAPEKLTNGTFNLYLIAVDGNRRNEGIGRTLMHDVEGKLKQIGGRILLVETSGLPHFDSTRSFYKRCGYYHEATIREFYNVNEDKIVFWKKLN